MSKFDLLNSKLAHPLLFFGEVRANFDFSSLFRLPVRSPCGTDRETDRRTDERAIPIMRPIKTAAWYRYCRKQNDNENCTKRYGDVWQCAYPSVASAFSFDK